MSRDSCDADSASAVDVVVCCIFEVCYILTVNSTVVNVASHAFVHDNSQWVHWVRIIHYLFSRRF